MQQRLAHIALVVDDYDEAIKFYTKKLHFTLIEDTVLSKTKRWVLIAPPGSDGCQLLLAKAATDEQKSRVGNQTGGRVFLFLETSDFDGDCKRYRAAGVEVLEQPRSEAYGKVVVFRDPFGNKWDLIAPLAK